MRACVSDAQLEDAFPAGTWFRTKEEANCVSKLWFSAGTQKVLNSIKKIVNGIEKSANNNKKEWLKVKLGQQSELLDN